MPDGPDDHAFIGDEGKKGPNRHGIGQYPMGANEENEANLKQADYVAGAIVKA